MSPLLTPKLDLVFKLLFSQEPEILLDLVNTMLASPEHLRLRSLEVKNPTLLPEEDLSKKFIILDILAVDERDRQYDIEMQVRQYGAYPERALYYLSKMYSGQLDAGQNYHTLKPAIGIHFLDYEQFPNRQAWQWAFALRDAQHPELQLTDHLLLHLVELPKFERKYQTQDWGQALFEWLHFLNHAHEEGENAMHTQYQNPAIQQAFHKLQQLSADEETRRRAEIRERALKDERSLLSEAREKGRKEGREEGLREGVLMGISALLDVKFGEKGRELLPGIRAIASLGRLQQLNELIRQAAELSTIEDFLNDN